MSDSAQSAYTVKASSTVQVDDRNDPPTNLIEAVKQNIEEPIKREIGETVAFPGGRDYDIAKARVVASMFKDAGDDEKALYIFQGKNGGISISLNTLKGIVEWAEKEK